ncbi:MAG: 50S ribosomal protein L28, partial [Solirubrobacteraceae bacterium]
LCTRLTRFQSTAGRRWYGYSGDLWRLGADVRDVSYTAPAMSKICHVCAKGPSFGHSRSHSMVATKRRFDPNLQRVRIDDGGTPRRVYVCTRCLKAGKVAKAR